MCSAEFSSGDSLFFQYRSGNLLSGLRRDKSIVSIASRTFFESNLVSSVYSVFCRHLLRIPVDAGVPAAGDKGNQGMEVSLLVSLGRSSCARSKLDRKKYSSAGFRYINAIKKRVNPLF